MKTIYFILICISILFTGNAYSQNIRLYASPRGADVLAPNNKDTLLNPWCGGWANPQISNIDLNGDGRLDLFVFEPGDGDNRVLTFLNIGNGQYQYAPEYESFFPAMQYWAILADYNKDGKQDIFTYTQSGGAMDVWKNVSDKNGLKFQKVTGDYLNYTDPWGQIVNIFTPANNLPAFVDIDGDGDLDILCLDVSQNNIDLYKNNAVEKGYSLDSFVNMFTNPNQCWGKVTANSVIDSPMYLGYTGCGKQMKRNYHGSTSLLMVDMDNDGDMDLLLGNSYDSFVVQMKNGRINNGTKKSNNDTLITEVSAVVGSKIAPYFGLYPNAYLADVTGDKQPDIIIAPFFQDRSLSAATHKTYVYKNTGTTQGNRFQFVTDNFLQETMLDYGEHAAPTFVDFNNDGLMDLVIANRANPDSGYQYDHLMLYKNIGTKEKAVYEKVDDDFASMNKLKLAFLAPAFADIDGDGRPDMIIGRKDGNLMYYKNIADSGGTLQMKLISDNYQNIKFPGRSTPCMAHLNSDSLFDLVVGNQNGNITYYKNTGTKSVPFFKKMTDSFGSVQTNLYSWYIDGPNDSILQKDQFGMTSPVIADFDHDGKLDMVSGSKYGEMYFWFDITDHLNGKFTRTDTVFYNTLKGAKENKLLGYYTMPAAADLNNDGYPELLIGNNMGGIQFYGSKVVKLGIETTNKDNYAEPDFRLYPNPAHHNFNVSFVQKDGLTYNLEIFNTLGKEIYSQKLNEGQPFQNVDVSTISPGVYFVSIRDNTGGSGVKKIVIQ